MTRTGMSDDVIIGQINNTRAVYNLDANALIDLHNAGVSQKVIAYMVNTANTVVAQAPPASANRNGGGCARPRLCLGGWGMGLGWGNLGLDWRTLGFAALSTCGLGKSALGARPSRLAQGGWPLGLRTWRSAGSVYLVAICPQPPAKQEAHAV